MKVTMIQPPYSGDFSLVEDYLAWELQLLDTLDDTSDMIVMPESIDVPCFGNTEQAQYCFDHITDQVIEKCCATAKRCHAMMFFNANEAYDGMNLNTTYCVNRDGEIVYKYYKQHPTPGEVKNRKIDHGYVAAYNDAPCFEMEGLKFCFLTCYDFYFYENCAQIARKKPDIIIGCSHQRTDKQSALEMMSMFYAYNTNAYVLRSSVSMGENETIGGGTMVVAPDGEILLNMKSETGAQSIDIDPTWKYLKPAGYKHPLTSHADYIEKGRRPWKYRPAGPAVCLPEEAMPYPRVCAHRGFNTVCPENSLPAYGAAVALGAEEIEFDLRMTKDGEIVSTHDGRLDRVSDGEGKISEHTYAELLAYDFGVRKNEAFKGLQIIKFEEILQKFSCQTIMNIHVKDLEPHKELPEDFVQKIIDLIYEYNAEKYCYIMSGNDAILRQFQRMAPEIPICVGAGNGHYHIVDRAIALGAKKVQLFKPNFNTDMIRKAKEHGIRLNVFWSDDEEETEMFLKMGVDTILTNDFLKIRNCVWKITGKS